jgi:lipopolysaccharide/colanic/teichoic acid biosynthesis glycosyltransferase
MGKNAKSFFDLVISLFCLILFSPIMLIICLLIYFNMGSPVIFYHTRPGLYGKPFKMYKFRTMKNTRAGNGSLLPDEQRLTRLGRIIRSTSLDELPELFNVIKGDMSLVGPRPLLMEYLSRYTPEQARRHEVKPGITGWAQINGRNNLTWEQKFKLDIWYVENRGIWLDIKILFITFVKVFKREGVNAKGHATMPEFMGYNKDGLDI